MTNAQEVLTQLNNTWTSMLDKFYDSVADEYLQWMAKEYKMDLKTLREKAAPLKEKLLSKAAESVAAVKTTKKPEIKTKVTDESKYGSMPRKTLVELCKTRSLPVKRKNQDMIEQLKKYDEDNSKQEDTEPELEEHEPEPVPVKQAFVAKKVKPTSKNELLEETLSESDEES